MKTFLVPALFALTALSFSCINDSDTLRFEHRNMDTLERVRSSDTGISKSATKELVLKAISGRFERYPDSYYKARIQRIENSARLTPEMYDDLSVAYERIGDTDKAIAVIKKSLPLRVSDDDKYRYHANLGTFLVHKWFKEGANRQKPELLKESIAHIEKALEINPNSHFGREKYQLALEKHWLTGEELSFRSLEKEYSEEDWIVALSGIIMMGLGYELPDVYAVLIRLIKYYPSLLPPLVKARYDEVLGKDGKLVIADDAKLFDEKMFRFRNENIPETYKKLREHGENVYNKRAAYIETRLAKGEHPDTHPQFWDAYKEPEVPILVTKPSGGIDSIKNSIKAIGGAILVVFLAYGVFRTFRKIAGYGL